MSYAIHYVVEASTRLEAIAVAVAKLRTGVKLNGVLKAEATAGSFWDVTLHVWEDV